MTHNGDLYKLSPIAAAVPALNGYWISDRGAPPRATACAAAPHAVRSQISEPIGRRAGGGRISEGPLQQQELR